MSFVAQVVILYNINSYLTFTEDEYRSTARFYLCSLQSMYLCAILYNFFNNSSDGKKKDLTRDNNKYIFLKTKCLFILVVNVYKIHALPSSF